MIDNIMFTYNKNYGRLNNLISVYKEIGKQQKGKKVSKLDILRSTVVFAHSTLEDYLRNILAWKLPEANKEKINSIPLLGTSESGRRTKFELGELIEHKDKSIDELINSSIKEYLGTVSFNDVNDISKNLANISIVVTDEIKALYPELNEMIKRRHSIVHNADRENVYDFDNHKIKTINLSKVERWKNTVDKFVSEINKNFYN